MCTKRELGDPMWEDKRSGSPVERSSLFAPSLKVAAISPAMAGFEASDESNAWLLTDDDSTSKARRERKQPTPLPKLQIGVLLFYHLAEPITSQCIYPFINQVCLFQPSSSGSVNFIATACE